MGIVVEPSPSTKVPYDLRNTLGCLVARTANPCVFKPSYSGFPYIVVQGSKALPAIKFILVIHFCITW